MATEVQIISTLDNTQSLKALDTTTTAVQKQGDELVKTGKKGEDAYKGIAKGAKTFTQELKQLQKQGNALSLDDRITKVKAIFDKTPKSVEKLTAEIKEYQTIALQAGRTSPVGQEFLQKAAAAKDELIDLQNETKRLSDDNRNLSGAIQGIGVGVSAFAGATAGAALFGAESEEVQKSLVKVTAAMTLLNSVQQIQVALQKESSLRLAFNNAQLKVAAAGTYLYAGAQGLLNAVVGSGSKAMKIFRIALISTGIGALVIGIGLLIANFDKVAKVVKGVIDFALKPLMVIINAVKRALVSLGVLESEESKRSKQRADERRARAKERIAEIEEEIDAIDRRNKKNQRIIELRQKVAKIDIDLLKARGASEQEVQDAIEKNNANRVTGFQLEIEAGNDAKRLSKEQLEVFLEANKTNLGAVIDTNKAIESIRSGEVDAIKSIKDEIFAAEKKFNTTMFKEELDGLQARINANLNANNQIQKGKNELMFFNKEVEVQETAFEQGQLKKRQAQHKSHSKKLQDMRRKAEDIELTFIEDSDEQKIARIQLTFARELGAIKGNSEQAIRLRTDVEKRAQLDIQKVRDEARKREENKVIESQNIADQLRIQLIADSTEKEKAIRQAQFDDRIADLEEKGVLTNEIEKLIKQQLVDDLAAIDAKAKEDEVEREKEKNIKLREEFQSLIDAQIEAEQTLVDAKRTAGQTALDIAQGFAEQNKVVAGVLFAVQKAIAIGGIIADTAKGITAAKANVALIPPLLPPGIPNPAFAIAGATAGSQIAALKIGAGAQIAQLASSSIQKFMNGGGSVPSGGSSGSVASSGGSAPSPDLPTFDTGGTNEASDTQTPGQNQMPVQAFIIQGDLNEASEAQTIIENNALFN